MYPLRAFRGFVPISGTPIPSSLSRYAFPVFCGGFVSATGLQTLSRWFCFCGGSVRLFLLWAGKKTADKHKQFGRDGVCDKPARPVPATNRPRPGKTRDRLWDKPAILCIITVKWPFCPICPWDGWGASVGRLSREGRQKKSWCVLCSFFLVADDDRWLLGKTSLAHCPS